MWTHALPIKNLFKTALKVCQILVEFNTWFLSFWCYEKWIMSMRLIEYAVNVGFKPSNPYFLL
jgi:hypothetical protein